jgi:very-short-patch-repair endonuclease
MGKNVAITSTLDDEIRDDMWFVETAAMRMGSDPVAMVRDLFPIPKPPVRVDSEAERRVWEAHDKAKLPALAGLVTQHPALRYRLDFALPDRKIGFEIDGYAYHSDKDTFERDRKRQRELELGGWRIIRFSGKEACDQPDQVVAEMARMAAMFSTDAPEPRPVAHRDPEEVARELLGLVHKPVES